VTSNRHRWAFFVGPHPTLTPSVSIGRITQEVDVFGLFRLHLALIPFLWSLWKTDATDDDDDSDDGDAPDKSDTSEPEKVYTKEQLRRAVARQVAEKRKEIEDELRAEATKKKLEADGELGELLEAERAEKRDLKAALEARDAAERNRILRYEIRDAARDLSFADPDDAYHLIDRDEIEFDDDGEPANVTTLVKALADRKPHLIKAESDVRRVAEATRARGNVNLTKDELKNKYLKQAGVVGN
jgi:hypothetical protein